MQLAQFQHNFSLPQSLPRLLLITVVIAGCFGFNKSVCADLGTASEYAVKAAYLYNFAKFVEWPTQAFPSTTSPLVLCIVGKDPFGETLDTIAGKSVREWTLVVQHFAKVEESTGCHILFISASESSHLKTVLNQLKNAPILTVSDIDGFVEAGGMIGLVDVDQHIRFNINLLAVQRADLKISSQLLKLGKVVIGN